MGSKHRMLITTRRSQLWWMRSGSVANLSRKSMAWWRFAASKSVANQKCMLRCLWRERDFEDRIRGALLWTCFMGEMERIKSNGATIRAYRRSYSQWWTIIYWTCLSWGQSYARKASHFTRCPLHSIRWFWNSNSLRNWSSCWELVRFYQVLNHNVFNAIKAIDKAARNV